MSLLILLVMSNDSTLSPAWDHFFKYYFGWFMDKQVIWIQAYLSKIAVSVPDDHNKANITIKQDTQIFWFPSVHTSFAYIIL